MDTNLLPLLFPEGLLDYFDVVSYKQQGERLLFYLEEKPVPPSGYNGADLESKGFYEEEEVRDFPLRGRACYLKIKRRKWLNKKTGAIVRRDWSVVARGTRMTSEFAAFLKEAFR